MRDKSFSTDNEIIPTDNSIAGSDPNNLSGILPIEISNKVSDQS